MTAIKTNKIYNRYKISNSLLSLPLARPRRLRPRPSHTAVTLVLRSGATMSARDAIMIPKTATKFLIFGHDLEVLWKKTSVSFLAIFGIVYLSTQNWPRIFRLS